MLLLLNYTFGSEDKRGRCELVLDVRQPLITSVLFVTSQKVDFLCSFLCCLFFCKVEQASRAKAALS